MGFQRCVLVIEKQESVPKVLSLGLQIAPKAKQWLVVSKVGLSLLHWLRDNPWSELEGWMEKGEQILEQMRLQLPEDGPELDVQVFGELTPEIVANVAKSINADLILSSPLSLTTAPHLMNWYSELAKEVQTPLLVPHSSAESWLPFSLLSQEEQPEELAPSIQPSLQRWLCLCIREFRQIPELVALLHHHTTPEHHVTLLHPNDMDAHGLPGESDLQDWAFLVGVKGQLSVEQLGVPWSKQVDAISDYINANNIELVVLALEDAEQSLWGLPLLSQYALTQVSKPVLLLPPQKQEVREQREFFAADAVTLGSQVSVYLEQPDPLSFGSEPFNGELELIHQGDIHCALVPEKGMAFVPSEPLSSANTLGISAPLVTGFADSPVSSVLTTFRLLHPGNKPLVLVDVSMKTEALERLFRASGDSFVAIGIRLRRNRHLGRIRQQLLHWTGQPWLMDASQILDDGYPSDLPPGTHALRMMRVALRLRAYGHNVVAVALPEQQHIRPQAFAVWEQDDLLDEAVFSDESLLSFVQEAAPLEEKSLLDILSQSSELKGNKVSLLSENREARETLLGLIDEAQERIHLQAYIIHDDSITQQLEAALQRASDRGVNIRILVDSLYSMHGSFGVNNEWIQRASGIEQVSIQLFRPIEDIPGLEDLKQRDHRKFLVVDGRKAIITGRNLAHSYYTSFDEVLLSPETSEDVVPWLDAGVCVEGPVAESVERSFLKAWRYAGGDEFSVLPQDKAGSLSCRLVQHIGLRDTYALDAQLAMIRAAQRQITLVNTFPLHQEVMHTLLRALQRGVDVRVLLGNVRPLYNERKPFPGNPLRALATQVVLSRIDPLVKAGARAYEFTVPPQEGWGSEISKIFPHVHAKIVTCDEEWVGLGSANFDITGGFWESEALLVVRDQGFGATMKQQMDDWLASSEEVLDIHNDWQRDAQMREWLNRVWPSIIA